MDEVSKQRRQISAPGSRSGGRCSAIRHVDRAEDAATDFDRPFQQLITEAAWGTRVGAAGLVASASARS